MRQQMQKAMKPTFNTIAAAVLYLSVLFLLGAFLCTFGSCTTAKKATNYMLTHPEVAAKFCADAYPVDTQTIITDTTITDTVLIDEPRYIFDTIYVEGDTVVLQKTCPPSKIVTQTVERIVENTAKLEVCVRQQQLAQNEVAALNDEIRTINKEKDELRASRNKFRLWFWIAVGASAMYVGLRIRKLFLPV